MVHHGPPIDREQTEASLQGDSIVCVSSETAEHIRTLTEKPVYWIPNAVDPSRLIARNKFKPDPGKKICLWLHRFSEDKRPELAIQIAECLPTDWHMIMAGHGNESLSVYFNSKMTVLPPAHPGDWLSVASCFLSTSRFDGFGLSVAEAICAGVPVVSSPAGIATEPGLATLVAHDAPPSEWAAAIVQASEQSTRPQLPAEYSLTTHVEKWAKLVLGS
jgi:glycosyltransferase involved in cell wall biosynthesis